MPQTRSKEKDTLSIGSAASKNVVAGRVTKQRTRKPAKQVGPLKVLNNPLTSLPGELRNKIYELVLVKDKTIKIFPHKAQRPDKICWKEPGLLRTSKNIRHEAVSMYYQTNDFQIYTWTSDFQAATNWLRKIRSECSNDAYKGFYFLVTARTWKDLKKFLPIAQFFHEVDAEMLKVPSTAFRRRTGGNSVFQTRTNDRRVCEALDEVEALGRKARAEDWDPEWELEAEFELWMEEKLRSKYIRKRVSAKAAKARE